jgi:probable rRNA maturation factor
MIEYCTEDVELPIFQGINLNDWIEEVADSYEKLIGELCYIFCSDAYILQVNREHLKHDYFTDIITFDYTEQDIISGDLFISLDTVKTNAQSFNQEYTTEMLRVIIHGVLHLCGLKDKSEEDAAIMRQAEDSALLLLKL